MYKSDVMRSSSDLFSLGSSEAPLGVGSGLDPISPPDPGRKAAHDPQN
jgi:hypothetical protein